jgi:natural product biosynthesis luciferase-like monooxygenase protein
VDFGYYILHTYVPEREGGAADVYARYLEQIEAAEAAGFDTVWVTEHHFDYFGGLTPSPQMLMTAIAQRTRRLRLGCSVAILPLHHPLRIAEDYAMVDVLSGGRLEFGAGRGMAAAGFEGYGVDYATAQDHMKEAVGLIDRAWREPRIAFQGQYYQCPEVTILPRPLQQPRPPIWVTANVDPASFQWVGAQGYNLMTIPWLFPPDVCRTRIQEYQQARAAAGHPGPGPVMAMYPAHVAASAAEARTQAEEAWLRWLAFITRHAPAPARAALQPDRATMLRWDNAVAERRAIFGGVDECVDTVRWLADYFGITHLGLTLHFGGLDHAAGLRSIELWGREVVPRVNAALATGAAS